MSTLFIVFLCTAAGVLLLALLNLLFSYRRAAKKEKSFKDTPPALFHEVFPELIYWETGDPVYGRQRTRSEYVYIGCADNQVILRKSMGGITKVPTYNIKYFYNLAAKRRHGDAKEIEAKQLIANDNYNIFLKELRKLNEEFSRTTTEHSEVA